MRYIKTFLILILFGCESPKGRIELKPKEIWGDRYVIIGDFDGDNKKDTLEEKFISSLTKRETNKYYDVNYDSMVSLTMKKKPVIQLEIKNTNLDTLKITFPSGQIFGLSYLVNLGDNNKNLKDEIGLVVDWADWSNVNSFDIYELNDSLKWRQINSFEIRDFDNIDSIIYKDNERLIVKTYNLEGQIDSVVNIK